MNHQYDNNEERYVKGNVDIFPPAYHFSLDVEFEKLTMYGVISSPNNSLNGLWSMYITPQGLSYFKDKEKTVMIEEEIKLSSGAKVTKQYDVFISHARKDKLDYVDGLYLAIRQLGVHIFYDTEEISWGDNWKQAILCGTSQSEFAIIVISKNFFDREWTERELAELFKKQNESGQKIVLPLLYNISLDDMKKQYPFLEEIQVIDSKDYSEKEITILLAKELIKRFKQI